MIFLYVLHLCTSGLDLKESIEAELRGSGLGGDVFGDLTSKMAGYLVNSRSDNTNIKYMSYYNKWKLFITSKGAPAIPASPIHVALYLTELIDKRTSSSVISATLYSIKWAHGLKNLPDPTTNTFVTNLLESAKRTLTKPTVRKEPILSESLITLCNKYSDSTDVYILRDMCMIVLAFNGFLRFDELIHLHCNDVKFNDDYFTICIRGSKTDQYRRGDKIDIAMGTTAACPYAMLQRYFSAANLSSLDNCFLFRPINRSKSQCKLISKNKPLSYTRTRECLFNQLERGDANIGLHSLRV